MGAMCKSINIIFVLRIPSGALWQMVCDAALLKKNSYTFSDVYRHIILQDVQNLTHLSCEIHVFAKCIHAFQK